jgi:hypothetical protein
MTGAGFDMNTFEADIVQEIYWLAEFPEELGDLEPNDLLSLKARLETLPDRHLDPLYFQVTALTSSFEGGRS